MEKHYETQGTLYFVPTMQGKRGLISLDYPDYQNLLGKGIMDEDVCVLVKKAKHGIEYEQKAPELAAKASLYTITIEGTNAKPQIEVNESVVEEAQLRGFRDGDKIALRIETLPTRIPAEASYDGLKIDFDL